MSAVEGFELQVHRSLSEPILLAGAPRKIAIVNGTIAAALSLGLRLWIAGVVVWLVAHGVSVMVAKRDPQGFDVLGRHLRQKAWMPC